METKKRHGYQFPATAIERRENRRPMRRQREGYVQMQLSMGQEEVQLAQLRVHQHQDVLSGT